MELSEKELKQKLTERGFRVKPENRLAITVKELGKDLEAFEALYQKPRLFINNYFKNIRTEVEAALEKQSKILTTPEINSQLNENYTKLIEKVNSCEAECLKRQPNDSFEKKVSEETNQVIESAKKSIEFLANAVKEGKGEPTFDVNGDPEEDSNEFSDDIQDIEDLIYDQSLILERMLLMNRTL
jgi:hypothetical protein